MKAAFNVGHFNLEELGMKYAADWIPEVIGNAVPVHYVPSGDIYKFELREYQVQKVIFFSVGIRMKVSKKIE